MAAAVRTDFRNLGTTGLSNSTKKKEGKNMPNVAATAPDGDALTYSLDVAPAGMGIDPSSGLIDWR